mgnify:CR=1 FL=1
MGKVQVCVHDSLNPSSLRFAYFVCFVFLNINRASLPWASVPGRMMTTLIHHHKPPPFLSIYFLFWCIFGWTSRSAFILLEIFKSQKNPSFLINPQNRDIVFVFMNVLEGVSRYILVIAKGGGRFDVGGGGRISYFTFDNCCMNSHFSSPPPPPYFIGFRIPLYILKIINKTGAHHVRYWTIFSHPSCV